MLGERESFLETERRIREAGLGQMWNDLAMSAMLLGDRERAVTLLRDSVEMGYVYPAWPTFLDLADTSLEGVAGYDEFLEEFEARHEQIRRRYAPPKLD
jgi:hypothetical protein